MWCSVSVLSELRWTVFCAHGRARDVTPSHEAPRDSVPHQSGEESGSLCLLNGLRFSGFGDVYLIQAVRLCRAVVNHFFKRNWLLLGWKVFSSNPQAAPVSDLTHSGAVCVTEPRTNGGAHRCGVNGKCSISASLRVSPAGSTPPQTPTGPHDVVLPAGLGSRVGIPTPGSTGHIITQTYTMSNLEQGGSVGVF